MTPDQLRTWRIETGRTQRDAAEWYGVSERQYRRYEGGQCAVPRPLVNKIREQKNLRSLRRRR